MVFVEVKDFTEREAGLFSDGFGFFFRFGDGFFAGDGFGRFWIVDRELNAAENVRASFGGFGDDIADFVEVADFDDDAVIENVAVLFAFVISVFVVWTEVVVRGFDVFFGNTEFGE